MIHVPPRRGLGAAGDILYGSVIDTGFGTKADCSGFFSWLLNSYCWPTSLASWQAINQTYMAQTYINPKPPATPAAPSTQAQMTGAAPWTPEQAISQTYQTQTQQNQALFGQVQANIAATQGPAAAGLYDCTKTSQLFTDTNNYLTNCDTTWLWLTGGAVLALLIWMKQ